MNSRTTERFRNCFKGLPESVKNLAEKNYRLWKDNPYHKSLKYKKVSQTREVYSVRIGKGWRALAVKKKSDVIWFWIGSHGEYDKLIQSLNQ